MSKYDLFAFWIAILLVAISNAASMRLQTLPNAAQREEYALAAAPEYSSRYLEEYGLKGADVKRNLDQIGGGHLLRSLWDRQGENDGRNLRGASNQARQNGQGAQLLRNLDHIGGGNLLRSTNVRPSYDMAKTERESRPTDELTKYVDKLSGGRLGYSNSAEGKGASFEGQSEEERFERNLDHIGGGHLLRDLHASDTTAKQTSLGARLRNLDHIGGGNLVRTVDEYAGYPLNSEELDV